MKMRNKKICFIYPSYYDDNGNIVKRKRSWIPSRTLPYLAALTPKQYEVEIVDERVDELKFSQNNDLIALTGMTNHIPRAIDIAKKYKNYGKKVIIGGPGAFSLQNKLEVMDCFDSIVIGEAEAVWDDVLDDFIKGDLKRIYKGKHLQELKGFPFARYDLLNAKNYRKAITDPNMFIVPIETSRGCPHDCEFCLVNKIFGRHVRYRPISEVVDEIQYQKGNYVLFTDDNIAVNPDRAKELFQALKPLEINWFGQFDTTVINNPDVIKLAGESGCRSAFIGIESLNQNNLVSVNKKHNLSVQVEELFQQFKRAKINVMCSIIFGLVHDTPESLWDTVHFLIKNNIEMMVPWILTPLPKTQIYEDYQNKGLMLHDNYSLYDFTHCVYKHEQMKPDELEQIFWQVYQHFYNLKAIIPRCLNRGSLKESVRLFIRELYFRYGVNHHRHPFLS